MALDEQTINSIINDSSRLSKSQILSKFNTDEDGLSSKDAADRFLKLGPNELVGKVKSSAIVEIIRKFASPLVILLLAVSFISFLLGEKINSIIVILMAILSAIVSFVQEHRASKNAEKLAEMVRVFSHVIRDGKAVDVKLRDIVPGDIISLNTGDMVPADARVICAENFYVNQSTLTGESFPVEKTVTAKEKQEKKSPFEVENIIFMGSGVVSGEAKAIVFSTGKKTAFGRLSADLTKNEGNTAFDQGLRGFVWLMIRLIIILGTFIFLSNIFLHRNIVEALLFALAMAVGLAPEMLPVIVTVNLSKGALRMAKKKVVVKKLESIQNFGAMEILCTDKTGTLTLDSIALVKHSDPFGNDSFEVLKLAHLNSHFQSGLKNVLDRAILSHDKMAHKNSKKIGEIPFDFVRKIDSVALEMNGKGLMITKGAPEEVFERSTSYQIGAKAKKLDKLALKKIKAEFDELSANGFRVLGVATKKINSFKEKYNSSDEYSLTFRGFVAFLDPPKPTVIESISELKRLGISLKILTGDAELVARKICTDVGLKIDGLLTGDQISRLSDKELKLKAEAANVFVRLSPIQKEQIIKTLRSNKHVVGFLGDGINDAPALNAADVGISVDNASDIAKETASIILLEKDLRVLANCITEGRKTFANVVKYIKMGASSTLGNMISLSVASAFLPFLPMLPPQVLLNDFLYDVSQMAIPSDNVDSDYLVKPRPWDIKFINEFMWIIGPISSIFDFATFGVMWFLFHASPDLFRTGWFVESLITQTLVVFIIRTSKVPFFESRPSKAMLWSVVGIVLLGMMIPFTIVGKYFSFQPLPALFFLILLVISVVYLLLVQLVKSAFIKRFGYE